METTVEKLEAMFQKSEADLDYIEKRLKLDFVNQTTENGSPAEENPVVLLENLVAIKAKHTALCSQVKEIAAAQEESMDSIRRNLNSVMQLMQQFQETADVQVLPLTESEQEAAELLGSAVNQNTTERLPQFAEDEAAEHEGQRRQAEDPAAPLLGRAGQGRKYSPANMKWLNATKRLLRGCTAVTVCGERSNSKGFKPILKECASFVFCMLVFFLTSDILPYVEKSFVTLGLSQTILNVL
ncbi:SKA complex subunit 2 isoform X1 [Centroberyx gerrardi]